MKYTVKVVKENGGLTDCAICYTIDPKFTKKQKINAFFSGKKLPKEVFTLDYYLDKAKELEKMGADIITIKDMAGLIPPSLSGKLIKLLKENISVPINIHTHCTPGFGLASVLMAIINGVDIVDTSIMNFSGGTAAPAYEIIHVFAKKLNIKTGVNVDAVAGINKHLKEIREELAEYDSDKKFPIEFHPEKDKLPADIDKLFDDAIILAKADKEEELLNVIYKIEKYFNFPEPNQQVKFAEIPGGMYSNMLSQLKTLQLDHLLDKVLKTVPVVRIEAGCPPLVTPTSQIVGVQAVNYVIDQNNNVPVYTNVSTQFANLVKGSYGKTPLPINPKFREKITGSTQEIPYNTDNYIPQDNPILVEYDGVRLAENEEEKLLLELFPSVATGFLKKQKEQYYIDVVLKLEEEERRKYLKEKEAYDNLSKEDKEKKLMEGLYEYKWNSFED
ncbi:MAG: carboxylase [Bacteroidetes bacterium HGW-Bacteroidetes-12]|nr:MAG: carboxylase [Bacteroidetes bacterium HGW-Bacteroidetes-12]